MKSLLVSVLQQHLLEVVEQLVEMTQHLLMQLTWSRGEEAALEVEHARSQLFVTCLFPHLSLIETAILEEVEEARLVWTQQQEVRVQAPWL